MSTKIYEAYRFQSRYINTFVGIVDKIMFQRALKYIKLLMATFDDEAVMKFAKEQYVEIDERALRYARFQLTINEAKRGSIEHSAFDLDCGINLWLDHRDCYAIPVGPQHIAKRLKLPGWARDYSYWDNTDRPDGVSPRAWSERRRAWKRICLNTFVGIVDDNWNDYRLFHEVVTFAPNAYIATQVRFETALGFWKEAK